VFLREFNRGRRLIHWTPGGKKMSGLEYEAKVFKLLINKGLGVKISVKA